MAEIDTSSFISLLKKNPALFVENSVDALGGAEELYEKLVKQVVMKIPSRIGDMENYLNGCGNLPSFGISVHGMKGSLMQIGCRDLGRSAQLLEAAAKAGDQQYCDENFIDFKERLLQFYEEITALLPVAPIDGSTHRIADFYDTLCKARTEAEEYDCISAAESISALTGYSFGEEIDALVSGAAGALEFFQSDKALTFIIELIGICKTESE